MSTLPMISGAAAMAPPRVLSTMSAHILHGNAELGKEVYNILSWISGNEEMKARLGITYEQSWSLKLLCSAAARKELAPQLCIVLFSLCITYVKEIQLAYISSERSDIIPVGPDCMSNFISLSGRYFENTIFFRYPDMETLCAQLQTACEQTCVLTLT